MDADSQKKERQMQLTMEEQQLVQNISAMLKDRNVSGAIEQVKQLINTSKNGELVRQYARLLQRLTATPAKKPEEAMFDITVETPKVTFKNFIGMKPLKKKLSKEVELMLKNREGYIKHGLKPSGILLYGSPGCGKSFLAESLAGEFGMSIIKPDLAKLFSQWVGETEKNIAKMVMLAAQHQPCMIFLDEVDAKMRNRANIEARGESAVNLGATTQFLETMQAVHNENNQIIFCAASNRVWDVDVAAKRPGRFGELIYIPVPSMKERFQLFVHYLKTVEHKRISPIGYLRLSLATARYSIADIEEICIKAKKDMLYKNLTRSANYYDKKYTKEEYLKALEDKTLPAKPVEAITTGDVMHTIKRDFKTSSVDLWYVEAKKSLLGWEETVERKQKGIIFSKTLKEKVKHDGSMTKDEQKIYKDMLGDVKHERTWAWWTWIIRGIARTI